MSMTVRELQAILDRYFPDENVTLYSSSHRNMQLLGVNDEQTRVNGCLTLDVDWSAGDKPVETELERLERQRDELDKQIKKHITAEKGKEYRKKLNKHKKKVNRTPEEQLLAGYIPTGKRGRPRKIIADPEKVAELEGLQKEE